MTEKKYDVVVIGGGQSGLAVGYYLRRTALSYTILDKSPHPGGSWTSGWDTLRLFSPAQWSSLPGVIMPGGPDHYPSRDETIAYLRAYEAKYKLPVERPVDVQSVVKHDGLFHVRTASSGTRQARAVINATGLFENPFVPDIPGAEAFSGQVIHSSRYRSPAAFKGMRTAVVGEGNSGAQILAEVSAVTDTLWVTRSHPRFLPDDVDGRVLFDAATMMYEAQRAGKDFKPPSLGDIVMVAPVKAAKARGVYRESRRPFHHFSSHGLVWADGSEERVDAVIFCTGFKPALGHLAPLGVVNEQSRADTINTRSAVVDGLWFVGYGNWTGFASATLIGVGRSAKKTVDEVVGWLTTSGDR